MTPLAALTELLNRAGVRHAKPVLVSDHELSQWPTEAVSALKTQKLLAKSSPARSAVCPGCERECAMPVHTVVDTKRAATYFIVCDKRSDINRVAVPESLLIQWHCTLSDIAGFIANVLELRRNEQTADNGELVNIGIFLGKKRSQMLCLRLFQGLVLTAGDNQVHLADIVNFQDGSFSVNREVVRNLVDSATTADPRYTPSNTKREARKLDTQAMYATWQKAYRAWRKKRPGMSDVWYAKQIEKTPAAQGRNASTIKKNMKS